MKQDNQFDQKEMRDRSMDPCELCEELLPEFMDGLLTEAEQTWLEAHLQGCPQCMKRLTEARQGSAWLEMLQEHTPEPRPELLARILAETSGSQGADTVAWPAEPGAWIAEAVAWPAEPVLAPASVLHWPVAAMRGSGALGRRQPAPAQTLWRTLQEPRLAMTAAMAFFSLALTLNLTGVRLREIHRADLRPASLRRTWYEAHAEAVRYYDNLGVVKIMESRLADQDATALWHREETVPGQEPHRAEPGARPEQKPRHSHRQVPEGSSQLEPVLPSRNPGLLNAALVFGAGSFGAGSFGAGNVVSRSAATAGGQA